jgi:hypothetical protein
MGRRRDDVVLSVLRVAGVHKPIRASLFSPANSAIRVYALLQSFSRHCRSESALLKKKVESRVFSGMLNFNQEARVGLQGKKYLDLPV